VALEGEAGNLVVAGGEAQIEFLGATDGPGGGGGGLMHHEWWGMQTGHK